MIEDLKADSARWDRERRAQSSRNTSGGIHTSREAAGAFARQSSNSPAVQYRYSETHQSRQHYGPTEPPPSDSYARDVAMDGPRYPGTGAPGYSGASGGYPAQAQPQYPPSSGAYGYQQQLQQSPPPDPRYGGAQPRTAQPSSGQHMNPGYQEPPYVLQDTNRGFTAPSNPYSSSRMSSTGAAQPSTYATAAPTQPGYPAAAQYNQYNQVPPTGAQPYPNMPQDAFYGRGAYANRIPRMPQPPERPLINQVASPAGQNAPPQPQGYSTQGQPQYEDAPRPRPSTSTPSAPAASSGSSNRRSDRDSERHPSDRHTSDRHHRSSRR